MPLGFYTQNTHPRDDGRRMKTEIVRELTESFESHAQQTEGGVDLDQTTGARRSTSWDSVRQLLLENLDSGYF